MKRWRRNNANTTAIRRRCDAEISFIKSFCEVDGQSEEMKKAITRLETKRANTFYVTRKEARTFFAAEVASPSALLLRLVYGSNYRDTLEKLATLRDARKKHRELFPEITTLPSNFNDALTVRE